MGKLGSRAAVGWRCDPLCNGPIYTTIRVRVAIMGSHTCRNVVHLGQFLSCSIPYDRHPYEPWTNGEETYVNLSHCRGSDDDIYDTYQVEVVQPEDQHPSAVELSAHGGDMAR
jgi:hypothetical protein